MFYLDLVVTTLTDDVDRYLKYETDDEARGNSEQETSAMEKFNANSVTLNHAIVLLKRQLMFNLLTQTNITIRTRQWTQLKRKIILNK